MSWPAALPSVPRSRALCGFIPQRFFSTGEAVCALDGGLQISFQRQDHGRQLLQLRGSEHPLLPEDAASEPRSPADPRADHN